MRAIMPSFGKRTPLGKEHFKEFIAASEMVRAARPNARSWDEGRFRCFTREWIKDDKDDSLDISWFGTANELPDPTILAQEAMVELEAAMTELRGIMAELGMVVEV